MPWQPTHICVFCRPAAASPADGLPCAQASAGNARAAAARRQNIAGVMFRDFLDAAAAEYRPEKQAWIFYGLAASAVKRANGLSLEEIALVLHRLPFVRIGRRRLASDDRLPELCERRAQARDGLWLLA